MTADAVKRLEALEFARGLGQDSRSPLTTRDPRRRRAIGDEQSGQIEEIGYNLYMELLERAVAALKSGKPADLERPMTPVRR